MTHRWKTAPVSAAQRQSTVDNWVAVDINWRRRIRGRRRAAARAIPYGGGAAASAGSCDNYFDDSNLIETRRPMTDGAIRLMHQDIEKSCGGSSSSSGGDASSRLRDHMIFIRNSVPVSHHGVKEGPVCASLSTPSSLPSWVVLRWRHRCRRRRSSCRAAGG